MKRLKRKHKTKRDRIYTYTCRFAVFAGIVMIFILMTVSPHGDACQKEFKMKEITYSEYQHILIPPYEKSLQIEFSVCEFFSILKKKNGNFLKKKMETF